MIILILMAVVFAIIGYFIAKLKHQNKWWGVVTGFLLGPFVLLLLFMDGN